MKKVRIFLGVALVTIAGAAAAANALKQVNEVIYFYETGTGFQSAGSQSLPCQTGGIDCKITNPNTGLQTQAYVYRTGTGYVTLKKD